MDGPDPAHAATRRISPEALAPKGDPMIGREVIGQFRIEKKLGDGGMGAVYLAEQTSVSRPAVIKVLKSQLGGSSEGTGRFAVEAKAASSLNHPNIVTIYNYGAMEDGTLFLAMEYLAGETLADRLTRCGRLPPDRAVRIAAQIASALGEAHAHGVVHRDLKPSNVMLVERAGEADFVKVLDFGIAKVDDAVVTSAGYVVGTPRYMSPEQLLGQKLDRRSDIYSTAIVLYEMLAGQTPFSSETPMGWMHQHVDVAPKPPSTLAKGAKIPTPIERVVLRALAKAPADRPPSMEMFALELVAALNAPTAPPWWRRALCGFARGLVVTAVLLAALSRRLLVAAWRLLHGCGVAIGRGVRRTAAGVWKKLRSLGGAIGRAAHKIAAGMRTLLRSLVARTGQGLRSTRAGMWRGARALSVATRALFIRLPAGIGRRVARGIRALFATRRRRFLVIFGAVLLIAGALLILSPGVRAELGLAADDKLQIKPAKRSHGSNLRPPARERPRERGR